MNDFLPHKDDSSPNEETLELSPKEKRAADKLMAKEARKAARLKGREQTDASDNPFTSNTYNEYPYGRGGNTQPPPPPPQQSPYTPLNRQSLMNPNRSFPGVNGNSSYNNYNPNQPQSPGQPPPPPAINPNQVRYPIPAQKKKKGAKIVAIVLSAALVLALSAGLINGFRNFLYDSDLGSGTSDVVENNLGDSDAGNVVLPTNPKPEVQGDEYVDAQGRYTPKGLSKVAAPAVVQIMVYLDDQVLYPSIYASGSIISSDGYILTCAHTFIQQDENTGESVVLETRQKIIMDSGEEYEAEIIGMDQKSDVAVLKFTPESPETLPVMEIGISKELEQGDMVAAISSPGGMRNALTVGYVSSVDREYPVASAQGSTNHYIQVDAAISPGSSGGALVNMFGQLVGVITWTYKSGADNVYEAMNFATPIDVALPIAQDLISKGYVSGRAWLGIQHLALEVSEAQAMKVEVGLLVVEVTGESPAETAGLQKGDVITHVDGSRVYTGADLRKIMDKCSPGQVVTVTVCRKGITDVVETLEIPVELGEVS